jgi:hypothetical protein
MSFGLLIMLIWSVACQSNNIVTMTVTPQNSANWWTGWLAQPVCKPPCWQNITPGVTTMDEALSILENIPEITITFRSGNGVDWVFNENKDEGGTLGASDEGIVDIIWLGSVSDTKLQLEKVIASYNAPEYVKPYDCREGMCLTALIYSDFGMFLSIFIENTGTINNPQFEILPDTIIDRVYFIEPGLDKFQSRIAFQDYDLLMAWKGYGEYP